MVIAGEGNPVSGIREILLVGSGIREISLVKSGILGFGIWNPSSTDKDSGIQNPCNSVLDSFTWGNFQSSKVSDVNHHIYGKWQTIASLLLFVVLCVNSVLLAIRLRRETFIATAYTDSRLSVS